MKVDSQMQKPYGVAEIQTSQLSYGTKMTTSHTSIKKPYEH